MVFLDYSLRNQLHQQGALFNVGLSIPHGLFGVDALRGPSPCRESGRAGLYMLGVVPMAVTNWKRRCTRLILRGLEGPSRATSYGAINS
jgi:hypothetical protein